jgi:hypothetical protein
MHLQLIVPALCVGMPPGTLRVPPDNLGLYEALGYGVGPKISMGKKIAENIAPRS